ncbi:MAG: hypothetical protein M3357_16430, partial [Actinomycetota bacterium]|nr:hypothetical protein [Actinomycetota bacterium]
MHGWTAGGNSKRWTLGLAVGLPILGFLSPVLAPVRAVVPGGTGRIAFTSDRSGNFEIYSMNADGSGVTRLTNDPGEDREPAWSPDGTKIVFVSYGAGVVGSSSDLFVMNADGTGVTNLSRTSGFDDEPAWSPDGTRIAWRTNRTNDAEIFVMNADGTNPVQVTKRRGVDDEPSWSPDGKKIVYRSCNPSCRIFVMNADGSGRANLTSSGYGDDPAWSPDGTRIAYRGNGMGNEPDIQVINATDGTNKIDLSNDPDSNVDPAWSPDGSKIAYVRQPNGIPERTGNGEIWLMNADGTGQVNLTNNPEFDGDADFQALTGAAPTTTPAPTSKPTRTAPDARSPAA